MLFQSRTLRRSLPDGPALQIDGDGDGNGDGDGDDGEKVFPFYICKLPINRHVAALLVVTSI